MSDPTVSYVESALAALLSGAPAKDAGVVDVVYVPATTEEA